MNLKQHYNHQRPKQNVNISRNKILKHLVYVEGGLEKENAYVVRKF